MTEAVPMLLWCPECGNRHVDMGEFALKIHHTHACQHCGHVWRPAILATVGVRFLPGFKDGDETPAEDGVIYRVKNRLEGG
jgi:rubredoxin